MSWYTKSKAKRFINSFKEDAYEAFESDIVEIRRISNSIMRRAQQSMHIENRTTNLIVQETRLDSQQTGQEVREIKQILRFVQQNLIEKMHRDGKSFSLCHAHAYCAAMLTGCDQESKEPEVSKLEIRRSYTSRDPDGKSCIAIKGLSNYPSLSRVNFQGKPDGVIRFSLQRLERMGDSCSS